MYRKLVSPNLLFALILIMSLLIFSNDTHWTWLLFPVMTLSAVTVTLLALKSCFNKKLIITITLPLIFACCIIFRESASSREFIGIPRGELSAVAGSVISDSTYDFERDTTFFTMKVTRVTSRTLRYSGMANFKLRVSIAGNKELTSGTKIAIERLEGKVGRFKNRRRNRLGLGVEKYLRRIDSRELHLTGYVNLAYRLRSSLLKSLRFKIMRLGKPQSDFLLALFLGKRYMISNSIEENFRMSGTLHVLALSGLHVGILYALCSFILFPLKPRFIRAMVITAFLLVYLFIVGMKASLGRATVMLIFFIFLSSFDRKINSMEVVALTAIVVIIITPVELFGIPFQLSFLAVIGIVTFGKIVFFYLRGYLPPLILMPLSAGLGAQIFVSPLLVLYFGEIHPIGILSSLLIVPFVSLFMWVTVPLLFMPKIVFNVICGPVVPIIRVIFFLILGINRFFSSVPGVKIDFMKTPISFFWMFVLLSLISILPYGRKGREV